MKCVVTGQESMVTGQDGLAVARVLKPAENSAQTGLPVAVT
jgi:hypothetical protein